ncbi:MAG: hypothetical protein ABR511_11175 [Acidimicrobiales bacterium]
MANSNGSVVTTGHQLPAVDAEVADLRQQVETLRDELQALRSGIADSVVTRHLEVIDDAGEMRFEVQVLPSGTAVGVYSGQDGRLAQEGRNEGVVLLGAFDPEREGDEAPTGVQVFDSGGGTAALTAT